MSRRAARRKLVTADDVVAERLDQETIQAIQQIVLVEELVHQHGLSIRMSQGVVDINLSLRIPVRSTLTKIGTVLAGLLTLAKIVQWLLTNVKLAH